MPQTRLHPEDIARTLRRAGTQPDAFPARLAIVLEIRYIYILLLDKEILFCQERRLML